MSNPILNAGRAAAGGSVGNPILNAGRAATTSGGGTAKKKSHHGILGSIAKYSGADLVGHLAKDVGSTAVGIGPGVVDLGKAMVQDEISGLQGKRSHRTLDIFQNQGKSYKDYYGHDVLHHLYQHPLQPILDALTVASAGAGAASKAGLISGERATLATRSPRAIATGKGPVHTDISSTSPLVRGREQLAAKTRAKRPEGTLGVGGELKKYGKQIQAEANQKALGRMIAHEPYAKATRRLSPPEWSAMHIRAMDIHPDDLVQLWKGTPLEATANDAKIRALVLNPSKRMLRAEPEARALSEQGAKLYKQQGRLKEETAQQRPDLTKRQASELLGRPVKEVTGQPYYFPHTMEPARSVSPLAASGGGKGVPKKLGSMKQNTGALALRGKLHLRGDVLGPEFLRRVKFVKYDEIHNALVRGAVRLTREEIDQQHGGQVPKGWEYVRAKAGQRIPATIRGEAEQHVPIQQLIPNPEDLHDSQIAKDGFSTTDLAQAHQSGGRYYVVPKSTVKAATGEFTRSSDFTRNFIKRPLMVWRALVLGLRPGFFTNNLVGNSVMYAARTSGQGALRDMFGAIRETHGDKVAKQILDDVATPPQLRADLTKEFFPEQVRGTFGRTQTPATSPGHIAGQKTLEVARGVAGAIPKVTAKVAEEYPRRALVRHFIRHSPEFKRVYASLPKQTRTFEEAARKVLTDKGGKAYQRFISKQVDDALGNYFNLSTTERNVLRNTLPFYSWYKAITTTTFHLAVDTPLRANILAQIGRVGKEWSDEQLGEVPSFLRGAIPLGAGEGGTKKVLGSQGLNPYATIEQLRSGVTSDITDLGLNPFLLAAAEAYAKQRQGGISPGALAGESLLAMLRGLPPARVIAPMPPSKLYPNRNRRSELYGYFGAPIKEYNPAVAAQQARQGR